MGKRKKQYAIERDFLEFGEYLKEMRLGAGLTQRSVAQELGYSSSQFISNFERGISLPPLSKLKTLIRIYNMPKTQVVERIVEAKAKVLLRRL